MSHLPHPVLLLQVGDPHPDLAQLQISLKHPPLPPVLITQCIGYKDVDCLLETDIILLFVIYIFSVQRLSVLTEEVGGDASNFLTLSTFSVLSDEVAD